MLTAFKAIGIAALAVLAFAACKPAEPTPAAAAEQVSSDIPAVSSSVNALAAKIAATGEMCGGIAGIACNAGEYCKIGFGQCSVADASGTCAKKPEVCTQSFDPVCGCDGKTYSNACMAEAAGQNVQVKGACPKAG